MDKIYLDKNGVEIVEGDVIKVVGKTDVEVVFVGKGGRPYILSPEGHDYSVDWSQTEVVGADLDPTTTQDEDDREISVGDMVLVDYTEPETYPWEPKIGAVLVGEVVLAEMIAREGGNRKIYGVVSVQDRRGKIWRILDCHTKIIEKRDK